MKIRKVQQHLKCESPGCAQIGRWVIILQCKKNQYKTLIIYRLA